jgi:archaellum biogenesis ATPase FlaH
MNVAKLKGATKNVSDLISFEVSPAYGIKILPFSTARG